MNLRVMLAGYPPGALTGMLGLVVAFPAVALCCVGAWVTRRAKRQRAFRCWLIAAALCAVVWVLLVVTAQAFNLP